MVKRTAMKKSRVAVHFRNGLGNFIMMTPAIQALCSMFNAKVDIVLDDGWKDSRRVAVEEFCSRWDLVDRVVVFQNGFDAKNYKCLFYSRHGETCETSKFFEEHNKGYDPSHINWRSEKLNEVDFYMNDICDLGYRGEVPRQYCISGDGASDYLHSSVFGDGRYFRIGFCNGFFAGSHWKWERKGWPYFEELADLLRSYYTGFGFKIYLFGKGLVEEDWASKLEKDRDGFVINTVGDLSISETIHLIRRMELLITTDTGLMHVADALNVPLVALFGPTLISKNGPYNNSSRIARSPLKCSPCQLSPIFYTCREWNCMKELRPSMVMSTVRRYVQDLIDGRKMAIRKDGTGGTKPCLLNTKWI